MNANATPVFTPPSPGTWELEATHMTRPATRITGAAMARSMREGFAESTARYGVGLSHFDVAQIHGFVFMKAIAFGAPPNASGPPPKLVLQLLSRLHPGMRARWRVAEAAFKNKQWRVDLKRWDDEVKPASIRKHRELQSVDPDALDDDALLAYVARCHEHYERMVVQHHQFTISCAFPVGDLLAHVHQWTGMPPGKVVDALRGSSPVSMGIAAEELVALGAALRDDPEALAALEGDRAAGEALRALCDRPGRVGEAARAYVDLVGFRCFGYDFGDPYALEVPEVLLRAVKVAAAGEGRAASDEARERVAALRALIPEAHRALFDELMVEARHVNRLRDERGVYSDGWAAGLLRRAVLSLGRRLASKGVIDDPALLVEATIDELDGLARGQRPVTSEALRARALWRATKTIADAPAHLGPPPSPPPPAEWFPENARRAQRATVAFIDCLFQPAPETKTAEAATVTGLSVNAGVYEGVARLVRSEADFEKIVQGDVLLTRATSPYFNVVLPLLGAIVTDRGGQLSHAAIVAREFGIPGVVGTRDATTRIPDGARVRVDGGAGTVTVIA